MNCRIILVSLSLLFFCILVNSEEPIEDIQENQEKTSDNEENEQIERTELDEEIENQDELTNKTLSKFATYCTTPNNEKGFCLEVEKCPAFAKQPITPENPAYEFFKASKCSPARAKIIKVCCGKKVNFDSQIPKHQNSLPEDTSDKLPTDCGQQKLLTFNRRIFGGVEASIGEFPWMGRLIHRDKQGYKSYGCSAFLVHQKFAITAAHCATNKLIRTLGPIKEIVLGDHDSGLNIDCADRAKKKCAPAPQILRVGKPQVHHRYASNTVNHDHDIALIPLETPANITDFVRPICLSNETSSKNIFEVSGWGRTPNSEDSNVKMKVDLDRYAMDACVEVYKERGVQLKKEHQICAGGLQMKDTCTGDSGGPLMVEQNNVWYAEGIVSFGIGCGQAGIPGVYTNIPAYMPWIRSNIEKKMISTRNKALKAKNPSRRGKKLKKINQN